MSVHREEVLRMARLARLELEEAEADALTGDLKGILEHVEKLGEVSPGDPAGPDEPDGDDAPPHADGRTAEPDPLHRDPEALAPEWRDGFFVVPRLPAVEGRQPDAGDDAQERSS